MTKWVYTFGDGTAEGDSGMRNLLGGKGANLAEMSNLGLPVPPGFTITTEVCSVYYRNDRQYPDDLQAEVAAALNRVEEVRGPGVVGEQPLLRPGEAFRYTSGCPLTTSSGAMRGSYQMTTEAGETFEAAIPPFSLDLPGARRVLN